MPAGQSEHEQRKRRDEERRAADERTAKPAIGLELSSLRPRRFLDARIEEVAQTIPINVSCVKRLLVIRPLSWGEASEKDYGTALTLRESYIRKSFARERAGAGLSSKLVSFD